MTHVSNAKAPAPLRSDVWDVAAARALYQFEAWSAGYFDVNEAGNVVVRPHGDDSAQIDVLEIVQGLRERGFDSPLMIRFSDILAHRLRMLHESFQAAIEENDYQADYLAVYPIKVNQQRPVVEEVFRHGRQHGFGLEVGSKPELLAVMALTTGDDPPRPIVCNGFKDSGYMEAVVLAAKLGRQIIPVIENLGELHLLLEQTRRYDVRPMIGVRVKIGTPGAGRWGESAGLRSKFGLFVSELLELVDTLRHAEMLDCLKLVHCHAGSQLHDISRVKDVVSELTRVYVQLINLGAGVEYLDIGGGLGVDYDGSRTASAASVNYSLREYASDVVYRVANICSAANVPHPTIISESGRAIAAYHSVLVFDVLGAIHRDGFQVAESVDDLAADAPQPLRDLFEAHDNVSIGRAVECFHDIWKSRTEAIELFRLGYLSLHDQGLAERLFWSTCVRIEAITQELESVPEELLPLRRLLADTFICNLSIFQSLPDNWAIDQQFPITPLHRLHEAPTRRATLADITCDSDGRIDDFADADTERDALDLHELHQGQRYYLAAYLVGAYQETLGDLHNLFGDTHVVHIRLHEDGGWWIDELVPGDSAGEVLGYVQYDTDRMQSRLARDCERAVRRGALTVKESRSLLRFYENELAGYTYLSEEDLAEPQGPMP